MPVNRLAVLQFLDSGVNREYVASRVHDLALPYATKTYTDTQDSVYASSTYYSTQDALLIPNAARGTAGGVASLGADSKIPAAQIPVLGVGIVKGPIPTTHVFSGNTDSTPFKIADWQLGVLGLTCHPWVFMAVSIVSDSGRPVVEVRAGTPSQTAYADQVLVAEGHGRTFFQDYQTVEVTPVNDHTMTPYPPTTNLTLTAWMFDDAGGRVTSQGGLIVSSSAFLARTIL